MRFISNHSWISLFVIFSISYQSYGQVDDNNQAESYKKRVLETSEIDFLSSYYNQSGNNAAVSGGIGSEKLTDATGTIVMSIPMNDDDVLTIDAGVSAYTSASSSNIDPFDTNKNADPFVASSGASSSDLWSSLSAHYSHSSDDRNSNWTGKLSFASEYDYFSLGFGGSFSKSFNEKNTDLTLTGNVYIDSWNTIYPIELRPFGKGGDGLDHRFFENKTIIGNSQYNPQFSEFSDKKRNSYSLGLVFSQILSKKLQMSLASDLVLQRGLLSTPFQRVYFSDIEDSFIDNFQLADDIERLPNNRFKVALGGRLHYYINEWLVMRTFYRYYWDDWGINSQTASLEVPIKVGNKFTIYPSYRFYKQSAADYFAAYEEHYSTESFYTSDFDLSDYTADQLGIGASYTDVFTKWHLWHFGLKSIDLKYASYKRNTGLKSQIITAGIKFLAD